MGHKNAVSAIVMGLGLTLLLFQNCEKVSFEQTDGMLVTKQDSEDIALEGNPTVAQNDQNDSLDPAPASDPAQTSRQIPAPPAPPTQVPPPPYVPPSRPLPPGTSTNETTNENKKEEHDQSKDYERSNEERDDDRSRSISNAQYICILQGPGKSQHLAIMNSRLAVSGETPSTVCMSEKACVKIVNQAFRVKFAEKRGYCPNKNPHVIPLSDADIQIKIDAILNK